MSLPRSAIATLAGLVVLRDQQNADHDRNPEQGNEPDGGRDAEVDTAEIKSQHAAGGGEWNAGEREQAFAQGIEQAVEQSQDQDQTNGNDDLQPVSGVLQFTELAGPHQTIT